VRVKHGHDHHVTPGRCVLLYHHGVSSGRRTCEVDAEREQRWKEFLAIGERNADKDPDEVEREIAEEIEAMRRERRAAEAASFSRGTPRVGS
jgi:hypothetical protein